MDFSSLLIAPAAALVTACVILIAWLTKKYSESRSLLIAFLVVFACNAALFQPLYYKSWTSFIGEFISLTVFGFAVGGMIVLILGRLGVLLLSWMTGS